MEAGTLPGPIGPRASGLLLHVVSLPSPYGIGDLGPGAYEWVDRLNEAGQTWWQALPLGPTGYANSPYQLLSSFAGNGLLLSPAFLIEDGLLTAEECAAPFSSTSVDYDFVVPFKHGLLEKLWARFQAGARPDLVAPYQDFCHERRNWLDDYALFRALKKRFNDAWYLDWPSELVERKPSALDKARRELAREIDQVRLAQFLLNGQSKRLRDYARAKGIRLIGDLPFFVSPDSSDLWAHPEYFLLDERRRPRFVAGVPPDCLNARGQLWGNPVYNWDALARSGYAWCIDRIRALLEHVDLIRLDHFRAFAAAWHVPAGLATAEVGEWVPAPGAAFLGAVEAALGQLPFIAEDLGIITPDVTALIKRFQIPGTRVLQFAFDGDPGNVHLPDNYPTNCVVYTGTHDNATTREWYEQLTRPERQRVWACLGRPPGRNRDASREMTRLAWSSSADLAIAPFQDILNLGVQGRMNVPGRAHGNWRWRATHHTLSPRIFRWLSRLTEDTRRQPAVFSSMRVSA